MTPSVAIGMFCVDVVRFDGDVVVKTYGPYLEKHAHRIDGGLNVNLNHEDYYTVIRPARKGEQRE